MGLRWTAWMPLMAAHPLAMAQLPSEPGLYRIRRVGAAELVWLGLAERGIRETIERLSRQAHLPVQPFDDPSVPARMLWSARSSGASFEVSGATVPNEENGESCLARLRDAQIRENYCDGV